MRGAIRPVKPVDPTRRRGPPHPAQGPNQPMMPDPHAHMRQRLERDDDRMMREHRHQFRRAQQGMIP